MTKGELAAYIRVLAEDSAAPYLCSDKTLLGYIAEAERAAAERALYLRLDASYDIHVITGIATYELSDLIILINRAKFSGESRPLIKTTRRELDFNFSNWESKAGTPNYYLQEGLFLTLYPSPDNDSKLLLDGFRFPEASMETPAQYHESLAYWCLYRFYSIADMDISNPGSAQLYLDKFTRVFGHKRSAKFDAINNQSTELSSLFKHPFM